MHAMTEIVNDYLARSLIKDCAKGGYGWRSTQQIAQACAASSSDTIWVKCVLHEQEKAGNLEIAYEDKEILCRTTKSLIEAKSRHPYYIP